MNSKLKIVAIIFTFILIFSHAKADEGMWIPSLLKALNESDMQSKGLKLTAEDIYSVNKSSLKDAIVHFGGGCTGEVVSNKGLIFTNHHCGYGNIASLSTVEHDYLKNGYWAKNHNEELKCEGLSVSFVIRIEDVTDKVIKSDDKNIINTIIKEATENTHYSAEVKPFNYGNSYFLIVKETYNDIRLVGTPPSSIGKYGADTDNWVWPRHTGDFSVFRIYSDKNNQPANYSPDNIPFTPRHHLPISIKGVQENDFAMVYGFPGRTEQFLTSYAVDLKMNQLNKSSIALRGKALEIIDATMRQHDSLKLEYASYQSGISNAHKKWIGENFGLTKMNALQKKKDFEKEFQIKANENEEYKTILADFEKTYTTGGKEKEALYSWWEFMNSGSRITNQIIEFQTLLNNFNSLNDSAKNAEIKEIQHRISTYLKFHRATEKSLFIELLKMNINHLEDSYHPDFLKSNYANYKTNTSSIIEDILNKSIFLNDKKMMKYAQKLNKKGVIKKLKKDDLYELIESIFQNYNEVIIPKYRVFATSESILLSKYVKGIRELFPDKTYWYDANSTLRVAYGKVEGSSPIDGKQYIHYTTADGILAKYIPGDYEFDLDPKLIQLIQNKDFGQYGKDGVLPVCFSSSIHTTGGNSGSPVINGNGELIGINFDRSWESTMSDVMFSSEICRNISVDSRYVLFIIDKFAGATHLIDEMTIIK